MIRNETKYHLFESLIYGKVYSKRGPERRRISCLKNLRIWFLKTTNEIFRTTVINDITAMMITNIWNEQAPKKGEDILNNFKSDCECTQNDQEL